MSLASISQNISANVPVNIQWSSTGKVSICFLSSAFSSFFSNAPVTQPVSLTLSPRGSGNFSVSTESPISSNVTGDSYVWTPSDSLVLGGFYKIRLSEQGGPTVYSDDYLICTEISKTVTVIIDCCPGWPPASPSSASQLPNLHNSQARQHTPSQGTIAGVAVGVAVFILLILTSTILCRRRRRRRRSLHRAAIELPGHQTDAEVKPDPHTTIWVPELGQEGAVHGPHELPGTPTPMDGSARADEPNAAEG